MAKRIGQLRYFGKTENSNNQPADITHFKMKSGKSLQYPIVQLGIQTLPGTEFFINGNSEPIVIGATGIFELNIDGLSAITNISVSEKSLKLIEDNDDAYIIIDYIYEE